MSSTIKPPPVQTHAHASGRAPIAIIGIGCRFPGDTNTPEAFWKLLCAGTDAIGEIPPGRIDETYYDATPAMPGKIVTRQGGFLTPIDRFDAAFFGISPREAAAMDPQQRLLLEVVWEAIDDAGIARQRLAGSRTGVFVGMWTNEYEDAMYAASDDIDLYVTTGGGRYSASGRISFVLDVQGPSLTVDTACSSSLVAVHLACQSLRNGESTMAVAGGVNLILAPHISIGYSRSRMLSPDARCKFGDARANGYVRSEGAGVVLLKPLDQALADGDPIYATILGSAVNNDGHSSGLLVAPSGQGQTVMLADAYRQAGVIPGDVAYVEAHGTGTAVGDPVELEALGAILGQGRQAGNQCIVGSVKTNIGHTEAASGIAGLIKAALCLRHRAIPASLHFETPNPNIPWADLPLTVARAFMPWPGDGIALAGVNSFGVTGTNAHVVLQAAPNQPARDPAGADDQAHLLALSARSPEALIALASRVRDLARNPETPLADLCFTAGARRTHHDHRLAIAGRGREALRDQLDAFVANEQRPGLASGRSTGEAPNVVFVFPGQGGQWPGMARQLLAESPVFRAAIERCDWAMQAEAGWSLIDVLHAADSRFDQIDVIQPTLFAVQIALAALWRSWGITPAAVVGHSMGEVAAAYVAGILTLEDAVAVICRRSRLMRRISGQGAMAAVELSIGHARAAITGREDRLAIAASNSPTSTVLSGDPAALETVLEQLHARDVFCRRIKVDVASHSPQVDPLHNDLLQALANLGPHAATTPFFSTVTSRFEDGTACDARYWARNLRQPVLFANAIQQLLEDNHHVFVEISPHPILLPAIESTQRFLAAQGHTVPSLRRESDEPAAMLASLGQLYALGCTPNWHALYPAGNVLRLPPYPWQRERFWYEARPAAQRAPGEHALLGSPVTVASTPMHRGWQNTFTRAEFAFLADHKVRGAVLLPATGFVELALAAGAEQFGAPAELVEIKLNDALVLPDNTAHSVQIVLSPHQADSFAFRVFSRSSQETGEPWQQHATGILRRANHANRPAGIAIASVAAGLAVELLAQEHYQEMRDRELQYGPAFRTVARLRRGSNAALAALHVSAETGPARHYAEQIALLDGGLQTAVAALPAETTGATFVPVQLGAVRVYQRPEADAETWSYAIRRDENASHDHSTFDVFVCDAEGQVLIECRGLVLRRLAGEATAFKPEWLYDVRWEPAPRHAAGNAKGRWLVLAEGHFGETVAHLLANHGGEVVLVAPGERAQHQNRRYQIDATNAGDYRWLLQHATAGQPLRGIVHAWSATQAPGEPLAAQARSTASVVLLTQSLLANTGAVVPQLWLVSSEAQATNQQQRVNPAQAPLWGLGRVLANEHAELRPTLVDIEPNAAEALVAELCGSAGDNQVALRGNQRLVARLVHTELARPETEVLAAPETPYCLGFGTTGSLDDLTLRAATRQTPGFGEIEVAVGAAGLNFLDVLKVLGMYPGVQPGTEVAIGGECSGTVVAVGAGVTRFTIGDEVIALTPSFERTSCFASHVTVPAALVAPRPAGMRLEAAAGAPVAFLTAFYALHTLGQMRGGQRVLIHAAAGGVGLAAVQLAQRAGAQVFATAGSQEKRDYLRSLGVEHVFDSRTLSFADQVLAATNGHGVDLVLNSLAGEALLRSMACLAPRGRFLEIGKRDIYDNSAIGMEVFKRNIAFFAIDLAGMVEDDPAYVAQLFQEVVALLASGELRPLPTQTFPIGAAAEAFRTMAQAAQIGKLVTVLRGQTPPVHATAGPIRSDATYLITGGLGALGLAVAEQLVSRGVRHLALMARSAPSALAHGAIDRMERAGATIAVFSGDVANPGDVARAIATIESQLPPLRGVVHAAGVLDDATIAQMSLSQLHAALAPKIAGAWNLHQHTLTRELDHFVLFSSVAALLGLPGQANYAAGNAFLDALAHARRAAGLPAQSIAWGPWAGIGLAAARANRGERLAQRGLGSIPPHAGLAAFDQLLAATAGYIAVMPFDANQWRETSPGAANSSLLVGFAAEPMLHAPHEPRFREALLAVEPGKRRRTLLENHVRDQIARVLRLPPARIETGKPLKAMGLDSLMAIEFKHHLEQSLGLSLSATLAWNYPTIAILTDYLADRMGIPLHALTTEQADAITCAPGDDLADLSRDELSAMVDDELAAIDALLKE